MGYNPNLGVFMERDPIESGANPYEYAKDNPITYVDPTGMAAVSTEQQPLATTRPDATTQAVDRTKIDRVTIANAVEMIRKSLAKYQPLASVIQCREISTELVLAILIKESQLDANSYLDKGAKVSVGQGTARHLVDKVPIPPPPTTMGPLGLGQVRGTQSTGPEVMRMLTNRLNGYFAPTDPAKQTGIDKTVSNWQAQVATEALKPKKDQKKIIFGNDLQYLRWDRQGNIDLAVLDLIDHVSREKSLSGGVNTYGTKGLYSFKIMAGVAKIRTLAVGGTNNGKPLTAEQLDGWIQKITDEDATRKAIFDAMQ